MLLCGEIVLVQSSFRVFRVCKGDALFGTLERGSVVRFQTLRFYDIHLLLFFLDLRGDDAKAVS